MTRISAREYRGALVFHDPESKAALYSFQYNARSDYTVAISVLRTGVLRVFIVSRAEEHVNEGRHKERQTPS